MTDYFNEILTACHAGLYRIALSSALTLPDVCASLYPNAKDGTATNNVGKRYKNWYNKYAKKNCIIDASVCYQYRCSMVHKVRGVLENEEKTRMAFFMPETSSCGFFDCDVQITFIEPDGKSVEEKAKLIDIEEFITKMVKSAIDWYNNVKDESEFKTNYAYFVQPRPESPLCHLTGGLIIY